MAGEYRSETQEGEVLSTSSDVQRADLREVAISGDTAGERMERCLAQLGNPHCIRVGDTPVRLTFQENGVTLEQRLRAYLMGLKRRGAP